MNPILRQLLPITMALMLWPCLLPAAGLNVLRETEVDSGALNFAASAASFSQNINGRTYQRPPMSTFRGWQYTTYYDGNRHVCLGRRRLPAGAWEIIRFTDYVIPGHDSHNVVTLGICHLDGTIHLIFDHHVDPLNYRVSNPGVASNPESVAWSAALFGPVTSNLGAAGSVPSVTYPYFFNAPHGNLMLYYRHQGSGNGDGMIHEYDGTTHDWTTGMGKFIARTGSYSGVLSANSTSRNPYLNGISYAGNRIHASWGWRESSGGSQFNHDLNYAYSDDDGRTWNNSAGTRIGTTGSAFISINSAGLVVAPIPQNDGLSNQYTHHAYPDGSCHVVVAHNEAGTSTKRYHHYWRDAAGTWASEVIPFSGSRPKLLGDDDRSLFLAYTSANKPTIAKGTPNAAKTSWTWSVIHTQSNTTDGGEGQVDHTRWEAERILSFYGQEKSNAAGDPTPLHIFDYQVSGKAILPAPSNAQSGVAETGSLEWTGGIGAVSHRIYLGTDPGAVAAATPSSPEYLGEQSAPVHTPVAPLLPATTYHWRIDGIDADSAVHQGLPWSFTTGGNLPPTTTGAVYQLFSSSQDASIREVPDVVDTDKQTTLLGTGGNSPRVDRCTVYVFPLPDFGAVTAPFTSASFSFGYVAKQGSIHNNDLYGLGRRSAPEVLAGDYYGKTATPDSAASLLETGILTNGSSFGVISTSPDGQNALRDYLNLQYASGAGAGEFVFLRLNTAGYEDGIDRATLTMSEGGSASPIDTRPRISITTDAFTGQHQWRARHFGTPVNAGNGADTADPNADGENNLLEFATGQDPRAASITSINVAPAGEDFEFIYVRNADAVTDGCMFTVEWSDTLRPDSWSHNGVSELIESETGSLQTVVATVPGDNAASRFARLKVVSP